METAQHYILSYRMYVCKQHLDAKDIILMYGPFGASIVVPGGQILIRASQRLGGLIQSPDERILANEIREIDL
jgi:hypothetical protein